MLDIFLTTLPIYLLIALGFGAVRTGYVAPGHVAGLGQFALKIGLPALIFFAIAFPRSDAAINTSFFVAYLVGSLAVLGIGLALARIILRCTASQAWIYAFGMANSNSGFLGFPLAALIFGSDAALVFAVTMTIENTLIIPLVTLGATLAGGCKGGASFSQVLAQSLRKISANPLIIAVVLALAVRATGIAAPEPLIKTLQMVSASAAPVALFVVGGTVAGMRFGGYLAPSGLIAFGKLIVHPVCVALALWFIPGVPPTLIPVGILYAAVPMLTIYPLIAAPFGMERVTSAALLLTTLASVVTVSAALALMGAL